MMRLGIVATLAAAWVSACTVTVQEGGGEAGESGQGGSSSAGRSAGGSGGKAGAGGSVASSGGSSAGSSSGSASTDGAAGEGGEAGATGEDAGGEGGESASPRGGRGSTGGGGGKGGAYSSTGGANASTGGANASTGGTYSAAGSAGATQIGSCTLVSIEVISTELSPTDGCEARFACEGARSIEVSCDGENDGSNTSLCDCREGQKTAAVNGTVPGEAPDSCFAGVQRCLTALSQ